MKTAARQLAEKPSALLQAEQVLEETRRRVVKLLYERGEVERSTLHMLLAQSSACWQITGIAERETDFVITVALPGSGPELAELTVEARELVITTKAASHPLPASLSGRLALPIDLQSERVKASLHRGALVITAPKAAI